MKRNYNKDHLSTKLIYLTFAISLVFMCSSAYCLDDCEKKKQPDDDKWHFMVTPYAMLDSMDLDSTIAGTTASIDLDFADLMDSFDVFAVELRAEARKGKSKWSILFDGSYTDLDGHFRLNTRIVDKVNVDIEQSIVDLAVMYRLFKGLPMKKAGCYLPLSLDVWGGGRYNYLKQEIKPRSNVSSVPKKLGKSKDWVEPLVGARIQFPLTKKLTLNAIGDLSGFGVGSASDRTWSCAAGFDYQLFEKISLKLAYRVYDIKYSNGSGTEKFGLDGKMEGPWLGMTFHL